MKNRARFKHLSVCDQGASLDDSCFFFSHMIQVQGVDVAGVCMLAVVIAFSYKAVWQQRMPKLTILRHMYALCFLRDFLFRIARKLKQVQELI